MRPVSSAGVCNARTMGPVAASAATLSTSVMPPMSSSEESVLRRTPSSSPAPYCSETTAPAPIHSPIKMELRKTISA